MSDYLNAPSSSPSSLSSSANVAHLENGHGRSQTLLTHRVSASPQVSPAASPYSGSDSEGNARSLPDLQLNGHGPSPSPPRDRFRAAWRRPVQYFTRHAAGERGLVARWRKRLVWVRMEYRLGSGLSVRTGLLLLAAAALLLCFLIARMAMLDAPPPAPPPSAAATPPSLSDGDLSPPAAPSYPGIAADEVEISHPIRITPAAFPPSPSALFLWGEDNPITASQPNDTRAVHLVAACSNRVASLPSCLQSWLEVPDIRTVTVVDWGSDYPLHSLLAPFLASHPAVLRIVTLDTRRPWALAAAVNLALHFLPHSPTDSVLKVDCDTRLDPQFVATHPLQDDDFYAGDWRVAGNENELHLNGVLYTRLLNLLRINGYDERLQSYGYDDTDVQERLQASGLSLRNLDYNYIAHLPHGDSWRMQQLTQPLLNGRQRLSTQQMRNLSFLSAPLLQAIAPPFFAVQQHRLLLRAVPVWNRSLTGASYAVHRRADLPPSLYFASLLSMLPSVEAIVSAAELHRTALEAAHVTLLHLGLDVRGLNSTLQSDLLYLLRLVAFLSTDSEAQSIVVHVQHGLSNRLRALASTIAIAAELKLALKLVWIPDQHCRAAFSDLFLLPQDVEGYRRDSNNPMLDALERVRPHHVWEHEPAVWSFPSQLLLPSRFVHYNYMTPEPGAERDKPIAKLGRKKAGIYARSAYRLNHKAGLLDAPLHMALNALILAPAVTAWLPREPVEGEELAEDALVDERLQEMQGLHIRHQSPLGELADVRPSEYPEADWKVLIEARVLSGDLQLWESTVRQRLEEDPAESFYVSSDTHYLIRQLVQRFGAATIRFLPAPTAACDEDSRSVLCVQHALADQLLLSRCGSIIGSFYSSYSEVAGLWRLAKVHYPKEIVAALKGMMTQLKTSPQAAAAPASDKREQAPGGEEDWAELGG